MCVCVSVCLSAAACPHCCTNPDVTWGSGRGCPLVVHHWADLQSVRGLRRYGNTMEMQSPAVTARPTARHTHAAHARYACRRRLPSPAITWTRLLRASVRFCPYCGGVLTQARNVSEYMIVLALCLVTFVDAGADVTVYNNSDGSVDDVRRVEPGTSQLATDSCARQRVDRSHVTFTIHPHRINKWSTSAVSS